MRLVLFIPIFAMGCALLWWGNSYRKQGKRFGARFGESTSPEHVMACGAMAIALALAVLFMGAD